MGERGRDMIAIAIAIDLYIYLSLCVCTVFNATRKRAWEGEGSEPCGWEGKETRERRWGETEMETDANKKGNSESKLYHNAVHHIRILSTSLPQIALGGI